MVTCKLDTKTKMNRSRSKSSSTTGSSGFRLLEQNNDQQDTISSISRNSYYKIKIDSMFDDSRSVISQRLDGCRGSRRTGSIIMYGKDELNNNNRSTSLVLRGHENNKNNNNKNDITAIATATATATATTPPSIKHKDKSSSSISGIVSNSVQAQIERMFTDVIKDTTACSFPVKCLGSLVLQKKVTSLQGLQDPLRQLYLGGQGSHNSGQLDICPNAGLRIRSSNGELQITPFYNIAVWSALKFVISSSEGGAAFLPLITDPEYIDKTSLFCPLTAADQRRISSSDLHSPIFAVVMRSSGITKLLECHGFICQTPEDAIVIAASLYQSLMAYVSTNSIRNTRRRPPRNQNGISCISIASSSVLTGQNNTGKISQTPSSIVVGKKLITNSKSNSPAKFIRKKHQQHRTTTTATSISGESGDSVCEITKTIVDERRKKLYKTKQIQPMFLSSSSNNKPDSDNVIESSASYPDKKYQSKNFHLSTESIYHTKDGIGGDILTRVAIPRSGSFLNTSGLTRYKSRVSRRNCGKIGGGGGSPLGFSELFNEFKLHENLHSLDEILNAIIDADGMSFNDLKPIYKEFLLKLAVTLTKDELYQRSKNIMRRQKKKKLKRRKNYAPKSKNVLTATGLKNVFWLGNFRSCKFRKLSKSLKNKQLNFPKMKQTTKNSNSNKMIRNNGTSGSDLSELRNENILNGINRNSSSGYVSCSECSYDSEACTCASADRCYCSLGDEKLSRPVNRESLITCKTEDKCYCSMDDTNNDDDDDDDDGSTSETTCCDSDSCISISKCYCQQNIGKKKSISNNNNNNNNSKWSKGNDKKKMGLDYELFTVGCSQKPVKSHEALSAKKSAEAAAMFAEIKVVQTTDIKSFQKSLTHDRNKHNKKKKDSSNMNHHNERDSNDKHSNHSDDILRKSDPIKDSKQNKSNALNCNNCCSIKTVSASLEDSLGYLP